MTATLADHRAARADLKARLGRQPRIPLGAFPTPLEPLPELSRELGGPLIYVKRDDLTGLALGGNKTRSLEYVLGELVQHQPEVLVTGANIQSNWCRQAAAAAARLGIPIVLVLRNSDMQEIQGNVLLDLMLGAEVRFVDEPDLTTVMLKHIDKVVAELRAQGRNAMKIDSWADSVALGYVELMTELHTQCDEAGIEAAVLWAAAAGPTQAGAVLGARALEWPLEIVGVAPIEWSHGEMAPLTADCANRAAALLDLEIIIEAEEIRSLSDYIGPGYGLPSPEGLDAMMRVARSNGLILDPVYTAKAMAALIEYIESGLLSDTGAVIFVHTGGVPAVFAHHVAVADWLVRDAEARASTSAPKATSRHEAGSEKEEQ